MKTQLIWVLWAVLCTVSISARAFPPVGYSGFVPGAGLGVHVADLAFTELERMQLECGVRVLEVAPKGPAARAGVLPGDVLTGLNGKPVYSVARLRWMLRHGFPDGTVTLELSRGGERITVQGQLSSPQQAPYLRSPPAHATPSVHTYIGVQLQEMTEDLREAFGAPQDRGVLVAKVMEGSPADQAGLKAGDLIVKLDRKAVAGIDDIHRALAYFDPGEPVILGIVRNSEAG